MRPDMSHALRHGECLPNPSRTQAARWGEARLDTKQALQHVLNLTNPRELRPQEVPVGTGRDVDSGNPFFVKPQTRRASQAESASGTSPVLVFADFRGSSY